VAPSDQPPLLELHDGIRDSVGNPDPHVHRELAAEPEAYLTWYPCAAYRSRAIDQGMLGRVSEEREDHPWSGIDRCRHRHLTCFVFGLHLIDGKARYRLPAHSQESLSSSGYSEDVDNNATRVLVVDDEPNITDLVATALRYEGFEIATAGSGRTAIDRVATFRPHLVVLDVMLPDLDGFEVARRLRQEGRRVPILFLTARDATEDKVRGLTLGGDDYVAKPFSLAELLARVRAVLRRVHESGEESSRLVFADLELDEETREVFRGATPIELTPTEFKLLRYMMLNPRRVLSKAQILDHVWEYDFGGDANVVETYISYLRKKIDTLGPPLIHTLRGAGYSMRVPAGT